TARPDGSEKYLGFTLLTVSGPVRIPSSRRSAIPRSTFGVAKLASSEAPSSRNNCAHPTDAATLGYAREHVASVSRHTVARMSLWWVLQSRDLLSTHRNTVQH